MTNAGFANFDKSIQKTNRILSNIEKEFNWQGRREQSYTALRSVLHALRDRMTVDLATNFAAQLPLLMKGIYYDGWNSTEVPVKMDKDEFENYVQERFTYSTEKGISKVIQVVFTEIMDYIDKDILSNIKDSLPEEVAELID